MNAAILNRLHEGALLADAAYKRTPFHPAPDVKVHENTDSGTQLLVIQAGEAGTYIGFAGTQWEDEKGRLSLTDIRNDLRFWGAPWPGVLPGEVHSGFLMAYKSVQEFALAEVRRGIEYNIGSRPFPVFIDGHSLGGALAQLCAFDVQKNYGHVCNVTTVVLGAPALFSRQAQIVFNWAMFGRAWSVVNNSDIVPRIALAAGWKTGGKRIYIDRKGRVRDKTSTAFRIFDRFIGRMIDPLDGIPDGAGDHRRAEYLRHLGAQV